MHAFGLRHWPEAPLTVSCHCGQSPGWGNLRGLEVHQRKPGRISMAALPSSTQAFRPLGPKWFHKVQ